MRTGRPCAVLALVLLTAGCGGLPLASGVHVERTLVAGGSAGDAGTVRVLPPGPAAGASPADIVRGFLNAQADGEDDYGIARAYLAPTTSWDTDGPVTVYGSATYRAPVPTAAAATVAVALSRTASLDTAGVYTARSDTVGNSFRLGRVGPEWRITALPAGLQLTNGDLQRSYQPATLWWFTPDQSLLVPEVRWLPTAVGGLQTQLVRALLRGPSAALAGAVRTAAPAGVSLDGSVSTSGSDIVVDLSQQAATLPSGQARLLLVQLARTLEQAPTADAVRLQVDGQPLPSVNAPQRLALSAAAAVDPDTPVTQSPPLALVDGRIEPLPTSTAAGVSLPAAAVAALAGRSLLSVVPAPSGGALAAVVRAGAAEQLLVATADGALTAVGPPGTYAPPSWSLGGSLVAAGSSSLLVRRPGAAAVSVPYPAGLVGPVIGGRLARDGVRVLLVAGPPGGHVAYLTTLTAGVRGLALSAAVPLSAGLGDVLSAGWQSAAELALLVSPPGGPLEVTEIAVDGSQAVSVPLPARVGNTGVTLSTASGAPVLVAGGGVVEQLTVDNAWRPVGRGAVPATAG